MDKILDRKLVFKYDSEGDYLKDPLVKEDYEEINLMLESSLKKSIIVNSYLGKAMIVFSILFTFSIMLVCINDVSFQNEEFFNKFLMFSNLIGMIAVALVWLERVYMPSTKELSLKINNQDVLRVLAYGGMMEQVKNVKISGDFREVDEINKFLNNLDRPLMFFEAKLLENEKSKRLKIEDI